MFFNITPLPQKRQDYPPSLVLRCFSRFHDLSELSDFVSMWWNPPMWVADVQLRCPAQATQPAVIVSAQVSQFTQQITDAEKENYNLGMICPA